MCNIRNSCPQFFPPCVHLMSNLQLYSYILLVLLGLSMMHLGIGSKKNRLLQNQGDRLLVFQVLTWEKRFILCALLLDLLILVSCEEWLYKGGFSYTCTSNINPGISNCWGFFFHILYFILEPLIECLFMCILSLRVLSRWTDTGRINEHNHKQ